MKIGPSQVLGAARHRPIAAIKSQPEDWRVYEYLDRPMANHGEHLYLYVEKRNLNTATVAEILQNHFAVRSQDLGYCGLKDKHGVTRQWFSVTTAKDSPPIGQDLDAATCPGQYLRCLQAARHTHKLRRGSHARNDFIIALRGDLAQLLVTAPQLDRPFANYFGPQRFGGNNLVAARKWLVERKPRRVNAPRRGLYLSVARSHLFNLILAERERADAWPGAVPGDVVGAVMGSLWGRGRSQLTDQALAIETAALAHEQELCHGLEMAGINRGLRPLAVTPSNFSYAQPQREAILELRFGLPPGAYATVMLQRYFELKDQSR